MQPWHGQGAQEPTLIHTGDEQIDAGHPQSVTTGSAWAVSIEVDGRQKYLFETDKLQEVVGASAIMRCLAEEAIERETDGVHVFQPASGEVRAWSSSRAGLLSFAWALREWLTERGVEHTAVALRCREDHFICDRPDQSADERTENRQADAKEPDYPDLAWVHRKLSELAGRVKNAKPGYDARPTCSLFESCRLHGMDFANDWDPAQEEDGQGREKRRALRSYRAKEKFDARRKDRVRFINEHVRKPLYERSKIFLPEADREKDVADRELWLWVDRHLKPSNRSYEPERPIEIGNLVLDPVSWFDESDDYQEGTDQFVAFMCADGDGIGRLLTGLDWNWRAWGNQHDQYGFGKLPPWKRNLLFSKALDHEVREAFHSAVAEVTVPDKRQLHKLRKAAHGGPRFIIPALPQIQGGDDLWTIVRKDVALKLCRLFARNMRDRVKTCPILSEGIRLSGLSEEDVSMSQGVAFAKAGHPVHAMIEAAESLLDSAKTLRKGKAWKRSKPNEGCLDWHWIESSLSETVADARAAGTAYVAPDTGDVMLLTTRPWTHTETEEFECAANLMMPVPRRKREQLDDILRRGHVMSLVAWEAWWNGLRECERCALRQTSASLSETWRLPDLRCDADVARAGCEAPKWRKHLPMSPWIHVGSETKGEKTTQYYITPLLDLIAMDSLAELDDERTSEKRQGATPVSTAPHVREMHG